MRKTIFIGLFATLVLFAGALQESFAAKKWQLIGSFTSESGKKVEQFALYSGGKLYYKTVWVELDGTIKSKKGLDDDPIVDPNDGNSDLNDHLQDMDITPDMLANTHLTTTEGGVKITTDKPIKIEVLDLTTGINVSELIPVENEYTFNTSNLPVGCRYTVLVRQSFGDIVEDFLIRSHNFCK